MENTILDDKYWERTINNPNMEMIVSRKVLWSAFSVLGSIDFEKRDAHWAHSITEIKKLLNSNNKINYDQNYFGKYPLGNSNPSKIQDGVET